MSCFFLIDNEDVWNPSNFTANLTLANIRAISSSLRMQSGASDIIDDECHIQSGEYKRFINASFLQYSKTNNELLRDMLRSTIGIGIVMLRRAGNVSPIPELEPGAKLLEYADAISTSMPKG